MVCMVRLSQQPKKKRSRSPASSPWHSVPIIISELLHHIHARRPLEEARLLSLGLASLLESKSSSFWSKNEEKPLSFWLSLCREHGERRAADIRKETRPQLGSSLSDFWYTETDEQ
ncbi:MAG: hypothetical protein D6759_16950 [Chloroflexi bacterium]|nr:MAG: hypothetical protein D6759_16950 [Chloroflexota bacterium]